MWLGGKLILPEALKMYCKKLKSSWQPLECDTKVENLLKKKNDTNRKKSHSLLGCRDTARPVVHLTYEGN